MTKITSTTTILFGKALSKCTDINHIGIRSSEKIVELLRMLPEYELGTFSGDVIKIETAKYHVKNLDRIRIYIADEREIYAWQHIGEERAMIDFIRRTMNENFTFGYTQGKLHPTGGGKGMFSASKIAGYKFWMDSK